MHLTMFIVITFQKYKMAKGITRSMSASLICTNRIKEDLRAAIALRCLKTIIKSGFLVENSCSSTLQLCIILLFESNHLHIYSLFFFYECSCICLNLFDLRHHKSQPDSSTCMRHSRVVIDE